MNEPLVRMGCAAIAAFVALIFLRAALHKLGDRLRFEGVLADYELAPEALVPALSRIVPLVELGCVAALVFAPFRQVGAAMAIVLLLGYALAMGVNLVRGRSQIDCGCGGPPEPLAWSLIARNLSLAAAAAPAAVGLASGLGVFETLAAFAVALAMMVCWIAAEQCATNGHRMADDRRNMLASTFGGGA